MFLLSGNVEIPDTVPVRRGFEFGGWSLTDGGSAPVTSVTVGGSDVELYAIIGHTSERLLDGNDGQPCQSVKRYYRKQSCAYGIIAGDLVNNGVTAEYNRLDTYI